MAFFKKIIASFIDSQYLQWKWISLQISIGLLFKLVELSSFGIDTYSEISSYKRLKLRFQWKNRCQQPELTSFCELHQTIYVTTYIGRLYYGWFSMNNKTSEHIFLPKLGDFTSLQLIWRLSTTGGSTLLFPTL